MTDTVDASDFTEDADRPVSTRIPAEMLASIDRLVAELARPGASVTRASVLRALIEAGLRAGIAH